MTPAAPDLPNSEPSEAKVRTWCCTYLAGVTRRPVDRIDPEASFQSLGLDSAEMLFLVSAIEDEWGVELTSDAPADHPNVAALSRFVAARLDATRA